jgi:carboxypeptidase Q
MRKLLLLLAAAALLVAQRPPQTNPYREADEKLFAEIDKNNELMANLEYLCDMIGPRLTGSDKLKAANQWTLQRMKDYGLENAHLEGRTIANAWKRGTATARIVEPTAQTMTIASAGWTPSTGGPVGGRLVFVKADKPEDLAKFKGQLQDTVVITSEPTDLNRQAPPPQSAFDSLNLERGREQPDVSADERRRRQREINRILKEEGVRALLRDSSKEHSLFNMTGMGGAEYRIDGLPTAFLTHEDYLRLWRLLQRKQRVEIEINIENETLPGPVEVYNTVGEIRGSRKPDEIVIVGAHLDSWDLGTGATDNGTGSAVVLEAARAIHALGLKPQRTIRFVLFTGEEQGLVGSRDYVKTHQDELDRVQGVVIHDTGTGRVLSFTLERRYDLREALDKLVEPLQKIGLGELSMRRTSGSDHVPFRDAGVPAFLAVQAPAGYRQTHHSQADTFDKVNKEELAQGAKAVAALAWNLSECPEKLPRKKTNAQPSQRPE